MDALHPCDHAPVVEVRGAPATSLENPDPWAGRGARLEGSSKPTASGTVTVMTGRRVGHYGRPMSESETEPGGIRDEDLPEDLQPGEDNPLAEPLDDDEVDPEDVDLEGGKTADQMGDDEDVDDTQ